MADKGGEKMVNDEIGVVFRQLSITMAELNKALTTVIDLLDKDQDVDTIAQRMLESQEHVKNRIKELFKIEDSGTEMRKRKRIKPGEMSDEASQLFKRMEDAKMELNALVEVVESSDKLDANQIQDLQFVFQEMKKYMDDLKVVIIPRLS